MAFLVLGEMVPKNIAIAGPERSALVLGPLLYGMVTVIKPLLLLLNGIANLLLPVSYVHLKDVLPVKGEREIDGAVAAASRRHLPDVQAAATVAEVVQALQAAGSHLGRVVASDRVVGIIALGDALEELIGEVKDSAHR